MPNEAQERFFSALPCALPCLAPGRKEKQHPERVYPIKGPPRSSRWLLGTHASALSWQRRPLDHSSKPGPDWHLVPGNCQAFRKRSKILNAALLIPNPLQLPVEEAKGWRQQGVEPVSEGQERARRIINQPGFFEAFPVAGAKVAVPAVAQVRIAFVRGPRSRDK